MTMKWVWPGRLLILVLLLVSSEFTILQQGAVPGLSDEVVELELLVDDFETGLPLGQDAFGNAIGYVPWGDSPENVILSATQLIADSALALPDSFESANTVLTVTYDINAWGGFTHVFTDGTHWTTQDWREHNAFSLWLYGSNTGGIIQVEIHDNRNPGMTGDTAERFFYQLVDDYDGWQQFTIPFHLFARRTDWQPDGAPNGGLGLDAVSGYSIGFPAGTGQQVAHIDRVGLTTVENISAVIITSRHREDNLVDSTITWDSRNWVLVWSDEFDGEAGTPINDEYWTHELGGSGWGNNELQFYTNRPENVSLDGSGNLAIVAREDDSGQHACHYEICRYTSARIVTKGKVEFAYGRVEARIKVPRGQGIWPAFWMLGANFPQVRWPLSGEIDIMENIGREPRTVHGTVHGPGYSGGDGIGRAYHSDREFADDFHVYAVDWDPDAIRWYVDGELFSTLTPDDLRGHDWVFDHDFFIILNVAVGGYWPGNPDDTTEFPQTMLVDYVRVYQLEPDQ
jgi:beta-glucanase (GH16 family)